MAAVSRRRAVVDRKRPHIYLHVYANGLKFWRVVPLEHSAVKFKHLNMHERAVRQEAYDFVSKLNMQDFGARGLYDT